MSTGESDEITRMLRDSAADFVKRSDIGASVRAWRSKPEGFDHARWSEMVQLGWVGVRLPESCGGAGLGLDSAVALIEELGRGIGPEPLTAVGVLAARALANGDGACNEDLMGGLAEGGRIIAVGWQEAAGAMNAGDCAATATPTERGWTLNGVKDYIHGAGQANILIVSARAPDGVGLFAIQPTDPGVTLQTRYFTDGATCHRLEMRDVDVWKQSCVATPGKGETALDAALDEARVAASAEMLGVMKQSLDMTLDYLRQRKQFGKAIGSFQALQHRAVDLYVATQLTRSAIDRAVRTLADETDPRERALAASACKARASDAALLVAKESIQMHGAIGYTDEHNIGLYVRRALVLSAWLGNSAQHRKRFAALSPALDLV